jgi:hypothetical protein
MLISKPRLREIYVNYPNDSSMIITTMTDDCGDERRVEYRFVLHLMPGETQIQELRRVATDILNRVN